MYLVIQNLMAKESLYPDVQGCICLAIHTISFNKVNRVFTLTPNIYASADLSRLTIAGSFAYPTPVNFTMELIPNYVNEVPVPAAV